jgi:mono/diheme cytochrome c family protein
MTLPLAAAVALLAGWVEAAAQPKTPRRTPELVARGKATYSVYCIACHGETGAGDGSVAPTLNPRPRNFATEKFRQGSRVEQIFETLRTGVPGTAMVKFTNLPEEDRWALAWYVLELRGRGNNGR